MKKFVLGSLIILGIILVGFGLFGYFSGNKKLNDELEKQLDIEYNKLIESEEYQSVMNSLQIRNTITIKKQSISNNNYLSFGSIKLRNDFKNYEVVFQDEESITLKENDKNDKLKSAVMIFEDDSYQYILENYMISEDNYTEEEIKMLNEFVEAMNILNLKNDIDFINYLVKNKNKKIDEFDSYEQKKADYILKNIAVITIPIMEDITMIQGDYIGYIYNIKDEEQNQRVAHILIGDKKIEFFFGDLNGEITTNEYITNLLSTLVVE